MAKFTSGNQPTERPGRGKSAKTLMIEALRRRHQSEDDFYNMLISRAMDEQDPLAIKEVLIRISPLRRSTLPDVNFKYPEKGTPFEKAEAILMAMADSKIPPDVAVQIIGAIKSVIDIEETTELKKRLEALEAHFANG